MDRRLFLTSAAAAAALSGGGASAAPKAELWPRWERHVPGSARTVDHGVWDDLLARHVSTGADGVARVDYARFKTGMPALSAYLSFLAQQPVDQLDRDEQMAFWINLYNALTVAVVLDHYPVESIRDIDISPGLFANGPWGAKLTSVAGEALSLDDIEHRILRPIWRDMRIHYAVNCASIGCPNLAGRAFTGARLEEMLEAGARAYITHPRGVQMQGGRVTASKIYDWFQEDFGGTEGGVIFHMQTYLPRETGKQLAAHGRIDGYAYDWSLNDG